MAALTFEGGLIMNNTLKLCPNCETGRKDYELDKRSVLCSYIGCLKDGVCSKFAPLLIKQKAGSEHR